MSKKRALPQAIFIACEGRSTEKNYFQLIGEIFGDELNYALTVYPDENEPKPKSDPVGLINEAINRKDEGFDELWAVFDKDGYTKHEDAFNLAQENDIKIAFSSIAFEEWILLHFGRYSTSFVKSDCKNDKGKYIKCGSHEQENDCSGARCVAGFMRNHNLFPDYSKSSDKSIYPFLRDKTDNAIINSSWLRYCIRDEISKNGEQVFNLNPYTNVDVLVKRLIGNNVNHYYFNVGDIIDNEMFIAEVHIPLKNLVIIIITPKKNSGVVINKINLDDWCSVRDNSRSYQINTEETHIMNPNDKSIINLRVTEDLNKDTEVIFKWGLNEFYHIIRG